MINLMPIFTLFTGSTTFTVTRIAGNKSVSDVCIQAKDNM